MAGDAVPAGAPAEPLEEALRGGSAAAAQPTLEAAQVEGALPGAQEDLDSLTKVSSHHAVAALGRRANAPSKAQDGSTSCVI